MGGVLRCSLCDAAAELRVYDLTGRVQVWVCPAGHGAVQRVLPAGSYRSHLLADRSRGSTSR